MEDKELMSCTDCIYYQNMGTAVYCSCPHAVDYDAMYCYYYEKKRSTEDDAVNEE